MGLQETGSDAAASGQLASEPWGLLVLGLCPCGEHPADPEPFWRAPGGDAGKRAAGRPYIGVGAQTAEIQPRP